MPVVQEKSAPDIKRDVSVLQIRSQSPTGEATEFVIPLTLNVNKLDVKAYIRLAFLSVLSLYAFWSARETRERE